MKFRNLFVLTALLTAGAVCARADDAKQVVTKTADVYRNLKSYRFQGSTTRATDAHGTEGSNELKFDIAVENPDKFRIEYQYPTAGNWVRVSDGKTLTRYRSITKQVNAATASPGDVRLVESTPIAQYSHLDEVADKAKLVGSEQLSIGGHQLDCYIVEIPGQKPRFEGIRPLPTKLWIDKNSYLVYREVSGSESGSGNSRHQEIHTTDYTNIQTSGDIPDTLFAFSK